MADVVPVPDIATSDAPTGVSHETFAEAKKLAEERGAENANLKAKLGMYEQRDRDQLRGFQPMMEEMVKELHEEASVDSKPHFSSFLDWTRNAADRPNIDTQLQLGTVVHACASKLKRVRDESSVTSATAEQLSQSSKENEILKSELGTARQRNDELSTSLKEITENHEKLQHELEKAGLLKQTEKFDFSKASSREVDAATNSGGGVVDVKTANASNGGVIGVVSTINPADALTAFVTSNSTQSSSRFLPSASNHSILGSNTNEAGIYAAIRPMM